MRWRPQRLRGPDAWRTEGFPDEATARYWADRSCGAVCVQAIVGHYRDDEVPLWDVISRAQRSSAYGPNGWIHAGVAQLLTSYGVRAKAARVPTHSVQAASVDGRVLICSVGLGFPSDGRRSGHLVVAYDYAAGPPASVSVMDPSDFGPHVASLAPERFLASFSGRAIECRPAS